MKDLRKKQSGFTMIEIMVVVVIVAILAAGQAMVIITGGIDLSVGSVLALSAVTMGWLIQAGVDPVILLISSSKV